LLIVEVRTGRARRTIVSPITTGLDLPLLRPGAYREKHGAGRAAIVGVIYPFGNAAGLSNRWAPRFD